MLRTSVPLIGALYGIMTKAPRTGRTKADLLEELQGQVHLLEHACRSYDGGLTIIGKHIALSLRVLLHNHGQSKALLSQLGLREKRFLSTANELNPRNVASETPLCVVHISSNGAVIQPLCLCAGMTLHYDWQRFEEWWNAPVIKDQKGGKFTRRELVLNVADTDGGAHVDPELEEAYMKLSRKNSLGWFFYAGDTTNALPAPVLPSIRQIAHEVLVTIKKKANLLVMVEYAV